VLYVHVTVHYMNVLGDIILFIMFHFDFFLTN